MERQMLCRMNLLSPAPVPVRVLRSPVLGAPSPEPVQGIEICSSEEAVTGRALLFSNLTAIFVLPSLFHFHCIFLEP